MEYHGGGAVLSGSNVPAFLTKLWTLVEDPDTDPLICWSKTGNSFHVFDQGRFSKEILPKFFKHNNMASFIRQLNMYGFRKVVHIEQGGLVKPERDDTEFQHPFFIRGQENLLENIKRKVTNVSAMRQEEVKMSAEEVNKLLSDIHAMKGKQESIDTRIMTMRQENEALWREVASLRQKHAQQQKVVRKLIQFLLSLVQSNGILGLKRKIPLMLNDSSTTHSMPKYSRPFPLESPLFSPDSPPSGPIISDITEVHSPVEEEVVTDMTHAGDMQTVNVKEEPPSPEADVCPALEVEALPVDTPLSPTTFINSILQDDIPLTACTSAASPTTASPVVVTSTASPGLTTPTSPSASPAAVPNSGASPLTCQTVACIDRCELSDHVENIESSLENLQNMLNTQTFTFDASPLMELLTTSGASGEFDIESLNTLLSDDVAKGSDDSGNTGKELVHYMATPLQTPELNLLGGGDADMPSLLELDEEPFFTTDLSEDDPTTALLTSQPQSDL
ncbi:heat shock factor protein 1 isoform X1 [Takifugu flavidus]|uniref:heat shock factor protein 1 isoform X1 n=1 Tax=Takifugu flavidus TaxID=433684 RepID=UPI0025448377|nr:heat shock factor protein 1 isoform X1 [Takifugu flavidus]